MAGKRIKANSKNTTSAKFVKPNAPVKSAPKKNMTSAKFVKAKK